MRLIPVFALMRLGPEQLPWLSQDEVGAQVGDPAGLKRPLGRAGPLGRTVIAGFGEGTILRAMTSERTHGIDGVRELPGRGSLGGTQEVGSRVQIPQPSLPCSGPPEPVLNPESTGSCE